MWNGPFKDWKHFASFRWSPISYIKVGDVGLSTIDKTLIVCSAHVNLQSPPITGVGQNDRQFLNTMACSDMQSPTIRKVDLVCAMEAVSDDYVDSASSRRKLLWREKQVLFHFWAPREVVMVKVARALRHETTPVMNSDMIFLYCSREWAKFVQIFVAW